MLIPQENWQELFRQLPLEVIPVRQVKEVLKLGLLPQRRAAQKRRPALSVISGTPEH